MSTFGKILRELRTENNLTQIQLAQILGVAFSTISMYERGKREPDFETMEAIADYFNVTMDYLHGKSNVKKYIAPDISLKKEKSPSSEENGLSDTQKEIIALFDAAPPELQAAALAVLKSAEHRPPVQDADQADK